MDAPAISIRGLTKRFGKVVALDAVDLDVPAGVIVGLAGGESAGKSTLVRIVAGLARPTAGSVAVGGLPVRWGDGVATRRRLGVVLQDAELPSWMTARDVLAFMADLAGVPSSEMAGRIASTAALLGIDGALDRRVPQLGAADRRRLALAQALVGEPELLLLDEPFGGLDPEEAARVADLLAGMRGSRTLLVTGRRLADLAVACDRIAVLDSGRLVADRAAGDLVRPGAPTVYSIETEGSPGLALEGLTARLRAEPWVAGVAVRGGSIRVAVADDDRASRELLPAVVGTGVRVTSFRREPPALQDPGRPV